MDIIIATGNENKVREIRQILSGLSDKVISMKEAGISCDIEENGETFAENALIKARAVAAHCDGVVIADDSGLCVDAMGGAPGVYSARFMGEETPYSEKNAAIIETLSGLEGQDRSARFVCAMAGVLPNGEEFVVEGVMEGQIAKESAGENGFGYDPIFFLPEYGKTSAEIAPEEKNRISHRGKALRGIREELSKHLGV